MEHVVKLVVKLAELRPGALILAATVLALASLLVVQLNGLRLYELYLNSLQHNPGPR